MNRIASITIIVVVIIVILIVIEVNVDEVIKGVDRRARLTSDFVKPSPSCLFNFELWGRGGEGNVMSIPSRTGV